jgi:hypothetical protein
MMLVRKEILPLVKKNAAEQKTQEAYDGWYQDGRSALQQANYLSKIVDIREYDLNY